MTPGQVNGTWKKIKGIHLDWYPVCFKHWSWDCAVYPFFIEFAFEQSEKLLLLDWSDPKHLEYFMNITWFSICREWKSHTVITEVVLMREIRLNKLVFISITLFFLVVNWINLYVTVPLFSVSYVAVCRIWIILKSTGENCQDTLSVCSSLL